MKKSVVLPFLLVILVGVFVIFYDGLSDNRIGFSKEVNLIVLDPLEREINFDFETMFNSGNPHNIVVIDGKLVLNQTPGGEYREQGYWESPIFDTQNEYILWDWVYGEVDFAGMQENLINNGGFENISCDVGGNPSPCGYYIPQSQLVPPYIDSNSSEGNYSFRFLFDDSINEDRGAFYLGSGNFFSVNESKVIHNVFDIKYDTDGSPIEFWYTMSSTSGWANKTYHGMVVRYSHSIPNFEEQYVMINATQFSYNLSLSTNYAQPMFFEYYSNDDYNNTLWIDDIKIFQDSPIDYRVRTSTDGVEWTDWTDSRYFVAERTSPGGEPDRYIQFNITLKTNDTSKTPSLNSLKMDYSKAFEFKIDWLYTNPSIIDPMGVEPAGTHGYVLVNEDGNFEFEDGTPIRFWSLQLGDDINIGSVENAELMCKKIRQMGFNMIKITSPLDTEGEWDVFDNMIKFCKDEGIYVYVQLNGGWPWEARKMLPDYWDYNHPKAQKIHMRTIMEHYNPYTNMSYKDDPQFVFSQITNEQSFHSKWRGYSNGIWNDSYGVYTDLITGHFQDWVIEKYPTFEELNNSWVESNVPVFYAGEELNYPNNIQIVKWDDWENFSNVRFQDTTIFLADLHENYYIEFRDFLVDDVGVKSLILPNNHYYGMAELERRQVTDVIDQHSYYGHPRQPNNGGEVMIKTPEVKSPNKNIISYIAIDTIGGMPMTISESNHDFPSIYSNEMPLFVSSYTSFHDWDQWTYFIVHTRDLMSPTFNHVPEALNSWFDSGRMALMPAASKIFIDSYVKPGEKIINISHTQEVVNDYRHNKRTSDFNIPGLRNDFTLTNRLQIVDFNASYEKNIDDYYNEFDLIEPKSPYTTDTGELTLDSNKGYFVINAPKVQGFVGETQEDTIKLDYMELNIPPKGNNFSSVVLIPLDDKKLYDSNHILLTAVGRTEPSETQWDADKRGYLDDSWCHWCNQHYGEEPVLVEGISGRIKIKSGADKANVQVLNSSGLRTDKTISYSQDGDWFAFDISDMDETLWYEIVFEFTEGGNDPDDPDDPDDGEDYFPDKPLAQCGDSICSLNESCMVCSLDCGICLFGDSWDLSGFDIDISTISVEVITSGGNYSLTINDFSENLNIYEISEGHIRVSVEDKNYIVELGSNVEIDVGGYSVYISYLEGNQGRAKLLFQNEWVRATESFSMNFIAYLVIYACLIFGIFFLMNKKHK
jgi:hypothetical protein